MIAILIHKGLPERKANTLIDAYKDNLAHAMKHHLKPTPTFRDVLRVAKKILNKTTQKKVARHPAGFFAGKTGRQPSLKDDAPQKRLRIGE